MIWQTVRTINNDILRVKGLKGNQSQNSFLYLPFNVLFSYLLFPNHQIFVLKQTLMSAKHLISTTVTKRLNVPTL